MKYTHGAQVVETIPGKRAIKSSAAGATTAEEVRWLTNTLVTNSAGWKAAGWAYIVDISKMAPAAPEVSAELVNLHKQLTAAGCKAMAFVEGSAFILAAQAKEHQKQSHAVISEGHFRTEVEALKWIDTIIR
ncbi:MAG: hypothetical protein IKC24_00430 [Oscillospiraceae bacterium]|nr:hypothetical protein [Oscillospiraceae bacterium]